MPPPSLASVTATAPCRIDCGGTLDIDPLALGLTPLSPATFNIALALPTEVRIQPNPGGGVRVESTGFEAAGRTQPTDYTGPLGFFFLAVDYFGLDDLIISIDSASPPRAALGGSSAALVGAVAALGRLARRRLARHEVVRLAHSFESATFMIPCGRQDHLAAAYGGVNLWTWRPGYKRGYARRQLLRGGAYPALEDRLVVAYPGQTHASVEVNSTWIEGFLTGRHTPVWKSIVEATHKLARAVEERRWAEAARWLAEETKLRLEMTPEVLTETGARLVEAAEQAGAGARFTGAGGGGCLWALGTREAAGRVKEAWTDILHGIPQARLLPSRIDRRGLVVVARQKRGREKD